MTVSEQNRTAAKIFIAHRDQHGFDNYVTYLFNKEERLDIIKRLFILEELKFNQLCTCSIEEIEPHCCPFKTDVNCQCCEICAKECGENI